MSLNYFLQNLRILPSPLLPTSRRLRRQFASFGWEAPTARLPWVFKPLISVVLPVYNQSEYLAESIESVLCENDFPVELIIVDDGSTDNTPKVLERYAKHKKIVLCRQHNQGLAQALNSGFRLARGSLLTWTSADNRYRPGALAGLAEYLASNPQVGLAYANVELIDENGKPLKNSPYRKQNQCPRDSSVLELPLSGSSLASFGDNFVNSCFMYRRDSFDLAGAYLSELLGFEDYDYWLKIFLHSQVAHIDDDKPLYSYRLHSNSLTAALEQTELAEQTRRHAHKIAIKKSLIRNGLLFDVPCRTGRNADTIDALCRCLLAANHRLRECPELSLASQNEDTEFCESTSFSIRMDPDLSLRLDDTRLAFGTTESKVPAIRLFAPSCLRPPLAYAHKSHSCLGLSGFSSPLLALAAEKNSGSAAVLTPASLLLPPIELPDLLRMARDNDYAAVSPEKRSEFTALIFPPDAVDSAQDSASRLSPNYSWFMERAIQLILTLPKVTFVLLCQTPEQRRTADYLNLELHEKNSNLRIVDITNEAAAQTDQEVNDWNRALMFVLSSSDLVLSLKGPAPDLAALLELRIEAALAAMAGIGIAVLTGQTPAPQRVPLKVLLEVGSTSEEISSVIFTHLVPIPHLALLNIERPGAGICDDINRILKHVSSSVSLRSLEQWLFRQSLADIGIRLSALALGRVG